MISPLFSFAGFALLASSAGQGPREEPQIKTTTITREMRITDEIAPAVFPSLVDDTFADFAEFDASEAIDDDEMAQFQKLAGEVQFQTYLSTPDVLDPAMGPYMDCVLQSAGAALVDANGDDVASTTLGADCSTKRERARQLSDEILISEGIKSKGMRTALISFTFQAIDAHARSMDWMNTNGSN